MSFPDGVHHKLLGTHCSFKLAPPLMSPRFDVVSCSGFLVVHVALLCPVQILYLCYQQYLVGSRGGFSSFLGFATAGVPDVRFLTSLMSIRLCAWRLAMESVRVLLAMSSFSTVELLWIYELSSLSREATICYPVLVSVTLLALRVKFSPLVSFWVSCSSLKAMFHCIFYCCHVYWLAGI